MQRLATLSLSLILLLCSHPLQAAPKHLFKIATLAPAGSVWIDQFNDFAKEVADQTGGEVGFRVYPGGVMGDDQAMYRKMRVGQLQGGGFTMTGIATAVPDFRVLAIPFLFDSYDEVDHVIEGLLPTFRERFQAAGLECVALTEVGFIYAMSTRPIATFDELKGSKNWSPSGDPLTETYLATLGITPIQLSIPDVLSSLQSGLIETVYNSLYGSIVLQWFTKARYIADIPYGYAYGVFALDGASFNRLPEAHRQAIGTAAAHHFPVLLAKTRDNNDQSRRVLADHGAQFQPVDPATAKILKEKSGEAVGRLVPESFSRAIYDQAVGLLEDYRRRKAAGTTP